MRKYELFRVQNGMVSDEALTWEDMKDQVDSLYNGTAVLDDKINKLGGTL